MTRGCLVALNRGKKLILGAAALATLASPVIVGILNIPAIRAQNAMDWQTGAGGKTAFDMASVKPSEGAFVPSNIPLDASDSYGPTNGRLSAESPLSGYIQFAYKVWGYEVDSARLPKWVYSDRYTIEARAATANPTKDQMRRRTSVASDSAAAAPSDPVGPTPLEAMNDQLGLKLEPTKASLPTLVIDRVERPSGN